jgi:hypothetical protein
MVKRVGGGILPTAVSLAVTGRRGEITGIFSTGRRHTKYVKNLFTSSVSHSSSKQGHDNVSLNILSGISYTVENKTHIRQCKMSS